MKQWHKIVRVLAFSMLGMLLCGNMAAIACSDGKIATSVPENQLLSFRFVEFRDTASIVSENMLAVVTCTHHPSVTESGFKPYQYDNGDDYVSDGCYRIVDKDGKIGYAAETHEVIIPPRFAFGYPFKNGRAKVTDTGHLEEVEGSNGEYHHWQSNDWYWIDKTGNRLGMD